MKGVIPKAIAVITVALLSICLFGCSQQSTSSQASNSESSATSSSAPSPEEIAAENARASIEAFSGTWELIEMTENGATTGSDDIQMLKGMGLEVSLTLNEDGTGSFNLFGEAMNGNWEGINPTVAVFTYENQVIDMSLENSVLTMTQGTSTLSFTRTEDASAVSSSSAKTSNSGSKDDLEIVGSGYDDANGKGYKGSDGNYYYKNDDGTYEATDGKGNGVRDLNGDGKADEWTTDSGKTWHKY